MKQPVDGTHLEGPTERTRRQDIPRLTWQVPLSQVWVEAPLEMNPSWFYQEPGLKCHSPAASIILIIFQCNFVF